MHKIRVGVLFALALVSSVAVAAEPAGPKPLGKVASVQNQVESKSATAGDWAPSTVHQPLNALDRLRTGPGSRAAILYSDQTLQRINEKSEVEVLPPGSGNPGVLRVISGTHYFTTRTPKEFSRIETPSVTAAIRGTEFVVDVAEGGTTTITMLEGVVDASNPQGSLQVVAGEQAFVEPGKAPVKKIAVRPRDAVARPFYCPAVIGKSDAARLNELGAAGTRLPRA